MTIEAWIINPKAGREPVTLLTACLLHGHLAGASAHLVRNKPIEQSLFVDVVGFCHS